MDSIFLMGAEDVRRAADTMTHAARLMESAANTIMAAVERLERLEQWRKSP